MGPLVLTESEEDDAVSVFVEELDGVLVSLEEDVVGLAESAADGGVTAVGVVTVFVFDLLVRAGDVEALELVVVLVLVDELG